MTLEEGAKHSKIMLEGYRPYTLPRGSGSIELADFWLRAFCRHFNLDYATVKREM